MKKITTVLFDYDGTLMDTNDIIVESWQHTFRTLTGKEGDVKEILKTFGEPLRDTIIQFFPKHDTEEAIEIYRSYQVSFYQKLIHMFPGMKELLHSLKERGYKVGLVTSRLRPTTMEGLEKYGISDRFDAIVTAEDTNRHKPDPEPALIALKRLKSRPEEALMVGDTRFDMGCGKNAGAHTVMVGWAMAPPSEEYPPQYRINHPEELFEVISKIEG